MAKIKKKKRRYYKSSLYDRALYYLDKSTRKNSTKYEQDFAVGYLDGMYGKKMDSKLSKTNGYVKGYIRSSNALEVARNVKF
ncbi:MAG: hypothetical protein IJA61_04065 [Clostridia bacterium]|nr:hypothetical protein [Clostridia bacterium]